MIEIDEEKGTVRVSEGGASHTYPMASAEAFAAVSKAWLRCGWDTKYVYGFTWLGRPVIQLPEDLIRVQEVIYRVKPDVIVETGVAHGGSLVFYASLCKAMGRGRVIGVDIDIRPPNRAAIEAHGMAPLITLIEGSSVDAAVVAAVASHIAPEDTVFVVLDAGHTREHVLAELRAYGPMVTPGSYIVAADGIMESLAGAPRSEPDWTWNNPKQAVLDFVGGDSRFAVEEPSFPFNEGAISRRVTYWPSAYVKRLHGV